MSFQSSDQILKHYTEILGEDFGLYFFHLNQSAFQLVELWDCYRNLFGTNEERVDLLNKASGYVANILQGTLHEKILLGICRISDPIKMGNKTNITIRKLPDFISDKTFNSSLLDLIDKSELKTDFARQWRNKYIAHADYSVILGAQKIPSSSRLEIKSAIKSILDILILVHSNLFEHTQFYHSIKPLPDEIGFLECVYYGVQAKEIELKNAQEAIALGDFRLFPNQILPDWLTKPYENEFDKIK